MAEEKCLVGKGIRVKGSLTGSGQVDVEGYVEGQVVLDGQLTVLQEGRVVGEIESNVILVKGQLEGEVVAKELITLEAGSVVVGNLKAPRIMIAEGARFKGNIDMDVDLQK